MEAVAEGLWGLADYNEKKGEIGKAVKCLEAICQSNVSFFPIIEVKTRLRIATLLLRHSHNISHAKFHLERSQLLLKSIPSCFELKFRTFSLLSHCYHLLGSIPPQKQILYKALDLASSAGHEYSLTLYLSFSSSNSHLLPFPLIPLVSFKCFRQAVGLQFQFAARQCFDHRRRLPLFNLRFGIWMFFATSLLHVHLMQWTDDNLVERAVNQCDEVWQTIPPDRRGQCTGLLFYSELLHIFYRLRICDYKNAQQHVDKLDAAMKADLQKMREAHQLMDELNSLNQRLSQSDLPSKERYALSARSAHIQDRLRNLTPPASNDILEPAYFGNAKRAWAEKLVLAPPPIDGEWLPKSAVYALVDLMVVIFGRPKGLFKEHKALGSSLPLRQEETLLVKPAALVAAISSLWAPMTALNIVALVQMKNWFARFPTILQACESIIEMLRGQYSHSVGCYSEAAYHYTEAAKLTERKSTQAMCQAYAAVSYFCIGGAESSSEALDLIGPLYRMKDSFVGGREEASILFAYGLLLMRQQDLQEARNRLAKGLQIAHNQMGNLQLVAQYLTILGSLALALHDTVQAREILRSSLTLAKKLYDIPTQIWVLSVLSVLYKQLGERGNEMENDEYQRKKLEDLQKRLADARSSMHHIELIDKVRLEVKQYNEHDTNRAKASQSMKVNLDIPESVGISIPLPTLSSARLVDLDTSRRSARLADLDTSGRGKRKF
ncbi:sister chromatid cohesion protein SCC4 [Carica papaya]|uniref:sister chromatid cohesion protein SCC4 n=1 Tax=Carica papaya TaxID=3649 RepID=UPI000B8C9D95|nr:sister chromatid cohesion protein SCC4 [Carica papaya]